MFASGAYATPESDSSLYWASNFIKSIHSFGALLQPKQPLGMLKQAHSLMWYMVTKPSFSFYVFMNQATGYASQHIWSLSQARINWEGCVRKGIWCKNGGDGTGGGTN